MAQGAGPIIWEVSLWSESAFGIPKVTFLFFLQYFLFVAKKCLIGNIQILVHIFLAVCVMIVVVCYLLMVPTTTLSFCNWMEFWWDLQCCGNGMHCCTEALETGQDCWGESFSFLLSCLDSIFPGWPCQPAAAAGLQNATSQSLIFSLNVRKCGVINENFTTGMRQQGRRSLSCRALF